MLGYVDAVDCCGMVSPPKQKHSRVDVMWVSPAPGRHTHAWRRRAADTTKKVLH